MASRFKFGPTIANSVEYTPIQPLQDVDVIFVAFDGGTGVTKFSLPAYDPAVGHVQPNRLYTTFVTVTPPVTITDAQDAATNPAYTVRSSVDLPNSPAGIPEIVVPKPADLAPATAYNVYVVEEFVTT